MQAYPVLPIKAMSTCRAVSSIQLLSHVIGQILIKMHYTGGNPLNESKKLKHRYEFGKIITVRLDVDVSTSFLLI
jgi:hypothetical protein